MSFNLQPREVFTIVRHLPDPGDTSTMYVQAIVRNSRTGATLDTLNLVESGANTHRFTKDYQIPADVSGLGFYIDVTTYVYTDSAYTTKSTVYGEDNNTYLVFDREKKIGGGSGAEINYKKIGKMIDDALGKMKPMKGAEMNMTPVMSQLQDIKKACEIMCGLEIPDMPDMQREIAPVMKTIESTKKEIIDAISQKEVTESTDISPALDAISRLENTISNNTDSQTEMLSKFQELHDNFKTNFNDEYPKIGEAIDGLLKKMRGAFLESLAYKGEPKLSPQERVTNLRG